MTSECQPHPLNRHLFIADNLDLLRRLDNESIDLICIDPPFKKSRTFVGRVKPPLTDAELAAEQELLAGWGINNPQQALDAHINWASKSGDVWFKDMWSYDQDVDEDWVQSIAKQHTALHWVIETAKVTDGMATAAYLCYMGVRLIQMHRALKPTGSLYLHCDGDANYYLRMALNAIFGTSNFRNEIVWHYNKWTNAASHFQRNHDTVLFYAKSEVAQYNKQFVMTEHKARVLAKGWDSNVVQGGIRQLLVYDREKAKSEMDNPKYDRIVYRDDADGGTAMPDVWADINYLSSGSKERTGYPTQKPVALAERIIKAATETRRCGLGLLCRLRLCSRGRGTQRSAVDCVRHIAPRADGFAPPVRQVPLRRGRAAADGTAGPAYRRRCGHRRPQQPAGAQRRGSGAPH